jgi:sterol desaturase/sphingolipid hydroxylase (fatty acid hydroxylase superfamily)
MLGNLRKALREELENPQAPTHWGGGWVSGFVALLLGIAGLVAVLCLRYPDLLTVPGIRVVVDVALFRILLHGVLIGGFSLAAISLALRENRVLGLSAITLILVATALGGPRAESTGELATGIYFGLDWFVLNLVFTGILFVPLERLFGRSRQILFRPEWREDLFYFLISSVMVQSLTFLSLAPVTAMVHATGSMAFRATVASQPRWLQFVEIMFLTDLVQYWVHRAFHRIPFLWGFHAIHHSARTLDWLAGSRMHFLEIVCLRGLTVIPMYFLGFEQPVIYAYLVLVYVYSTYIHANVKFDIEWLKPFIVTPRFHHWHHGVEPEAIDVNFAIHFPLFDRLFGTYHMPKGGWPKGYGVAGHPVPSGYLRQAAYPLVRSGS